MGSGNSSRIIRRRGGSLAAAVTLAWLGILLPRASAQNLPKAPGRELTTVTPQPGFFTEPSIAVNPRNPGQVVAAFQDNAHIAYSLDAGRHWKLATGIAPPGYRVSGDVSVTYDSSGHAILCYMAFDKLGTFNYWGHNSSRNGLYVRRSLDGGKTWEANDIAIIHHPTAPGVPWEDKPYIVADDSQGPHAGNLYVGWTRWTLTDSEMLLSRSTDGGKTWSKPIEIDDGPGLPRDDNGALEGFGGAVGPDGTLYAVWSDGRHIYFTQSSDGGVTFTRPRKAIPTAPSMFGVQAVSRANGFPQIGIDPASGRLWVTWSDYRNGDIDVFCSTSSDRGRTWTPAVRVNSDAVHNGADQFFQWLAVDPADGSADVVYYDRRGDPRNRDQIVVLARSTDGGRSFRNYRWTDQPFNAAGVFLGDYNGIAALNGRVYGVWTVKPLAPAGSQAEGRRLRRGSPEYWRLRGTQIQIGVADFTKPGTNAAKSATGARKR